MKTTSSTLAEKFIMELILALVAGYQHQSESKAPWCVVFDPMNQKVRFTYSIVSPTWDLILFAGDSAIAQAGCGWTTSEYAKLLAPLVVSDALSRVQYTALAASVARDAVMLLNEILKDLRKLHPNSRHDYEDFHRMEIEQIQNQ